MNQLRVVLNDKDTVAELAKDPEVELKIKQSIVDCAAKRAAKALNGDINDAIRNEVRRITHPDEDNGLFRRTSRYGEPRLSDELVKEIKTRVEVYVKQAVTETVEETDVVKAFEEAFAKRRAEIESYDFDAAVQKFIKKKISESLGKLIV